MNSFKNLLDFAQPLGFSKKFFFGKSKYKYPINDKNNRVHYYRIGCICKDGTLSNATRHGACSHCGGVEYWINIMF